MLLQTYRVRDSFSPASENAVTGLGFRERRALQLQLLRARVRAYGREGARPGPPEQDGRARAALGSHRGSLGERWRSHFLFRL